MLIVDIPETIKGPYNQSVYKGRYMKTAKGYWYCMELDWGINRRMKYVRQIDVLNGLINEI